MGNGEDPGDPARALALGLLLAIPLWLVVWRALALLIELIGAIA